MTTDRDTLKRGKEVFAENCAGCHSSKLPEKAVTFFPNDGCVGPDYLNCWNQYWSWTKSAEFREQMKQIVSKDDFLVDNFLSTDLRVPVTLLETNMCASLATNALKGDTWDNFSSTSYKNLPSVGSTMIHHPITREPQAYSMLDGGRGYIRPPSLASLWSTAPFLLNNTLGKFYPSGTVEDRMKSFNTSIEQLLWPEKRYCDQRDLYAMNDYYAEDYEADGQKSCQDRTYLTRSGKEVPGIIDRTWARSWLLVPEGYLPWYVRVPIHDGVLNLGPIPAGTPVNLLSNLDLENRGSEVKSLLKKLKWHLGDLVAAKVFADRITDEELRRVYADLVDPLLEVNKCPDFVVNRGHYFGTDYLPANEGRPGLGESDKRALIEFLKTM